MTLDAGTHLVTIKDYNEFPEVEGKKPYVKVTFADDLNETIDWYGYLSEAAFEGTSKRLDTLGIKWDLAQEKGFNKDSGCLNTSTVFVLTIDLDEYKGKSRPKVSSFYPYQVPVTSGGRSTLLARAQAFGKVKATTTKNQMSTDLNEIPF